MDRESATERIPLASSEDLRVRWRGLALIFDEPTLNRLVALLAERIPEIEDLKVHVTPGELAVIPIPDQLLSYLVQRAPRGLLTYYPDDRIMVVNLAPWMPPGIDLSLERTVFAEGALTLEFGDGS